MVFHKKFKKRLKKTKETLKTAEVKTRGFRKGAVKFAKGTARLAAATGRASARVSESLGDPRGIGGAEFASGFGFTESKRRKKGKGRRKTQVITSFELPELL